jgi:hypothetical protein
MPANMGCDVITFRCGKCGFALEVREGLAGKKVKCQACHAVVDVPNPRASSIAAQAAGQRSAQDDRPAPGFFTDLSKFDPRDPNAPPLPGDPPPTLWSRPGFRAAVLCVLALAILGGVLYAISWALTDRWEEETYPAISAQYSQAAGSWDQHKTNDAQQAYGRLLKTLRERSQQHPLQDERMIELFRKVQQDARAIDQECLRNISLAVTRIDPLAQKMPAGAVSQYDAILAGLAKLDPSTPGVDTLRREIQAKRDPLAAQAKAIREYLESFDPFFQQTIPFLRRLRWGMPAGMFVNRAPKIIEAWRGIKDPPDRSSAGSLLSETNDLAVSLTNLQRQVETQNKELKLDDFRKRLMDLRPKELSENDWSQKVGQYLNTFTRLRCVGRTVRYDKESQHDFELRLVKLETSYRQQYALQLGTAYAGEHTCMPDAKQDAGKRQAFLDSFTPFLELAIPTVRRLERGAERQVLTGRMSDLDDRFSKTLDPPDDSDIGGFLEDINLFAEQAFVYAYFKRGSTALDIVGQNQVDSKLINDRADDLERRIQQYKRDHIEPK